MKTISILGSTGSIGTNTLRVTSSFPEKFRVAGLSGGRNIPLLARQIEEVSPEIASCMDAGGARELESVLRQRGYRLSRTRIVHGVEGNIQVASHPESSVVLSAISGAAGLLPTYRALEEGKTIALANKETLVMAGELIMRLSLEKNSEIIPVDSEHNAIHQCLRGGRKKEVRRLILTASGGPFRATPASDFCSVTPEQALSHPTWSMGKKITIDSATLMNKGLEVIEASWLFETPAEEIEVVVHPQSVIHSMVEFIDGSILAQLGLTDMRIAIQYALTYPDRCATPLPSLDIHKISRLEFSEPDREKFRCLEIAYRALSEGGTAAAVMNAANEVAVEAFLDHRLAFNEIPQLIESVMDAHAVEKIEGLESVLKADAWARGEAALLCRSARKVASSH
jgi:1-deoxy-D-xylulose-5-phosphate reductoisomerase